MKAVKELIIDNLVKGFSSPASSSSEQRSLKVLDGISIDIMQGEIIVLLGPSGCGKSTLLNIMAGFERPDQGRVLCQGQLVQCPSPERGVIFQSAVLFPWLSVQENIAYGLTLKKYRDQEKEAVCQHLIQLVGLDGFEEYYPHQLSGGMQQRTSLARVLALKPRVLLMDEPFAALDALSRLKMQQLLLSIWETMHTTIVFVTHDVEEALILADKIYVMSKLPGRIISKTLVPFPRPRPVSLIGNLEFSKLKSEILELLFQQG